MSMAGDDKTRGEAEVPEQAPAVTRHPSGQVTVDDLADTAAPTMSLDADRAETELLHGAPADVTAETMSELVAPPAEPERESDDLLTARTMADLHDGDDAAATGNVEVTVRSSTQAFGDDEEADEDLEARIAAQLSRGKKKKRDVLIGQVIAGRFEVTGKIGAGGMGAVYKAKQLGMDRDVAIKVLLQELASNETITRRFTLEALAVSRLKHPNTIQIFDFGQTPQGNLYIAMELLEGSTLHDLRRKQGRLPVRLALRIIAMAAASLAEAHGKGIVHRDLKPENIFLTRVADDPYFAKVLDFGVAKLRDPGAAGEKGTLTKAGSIFGTPRYMSPEQCKAQPVDARADLYALGVILYEMLVGRPPFDSKEPLTLLVAHANDEPPRPMDVAPEVAIPLEVESLVMKLLEKEPADRVQSAGDLEKTCQGLYHSLPEAFDEAVDIEQAQELGVPLPTEMTVLLPSAGPADETVNLDGPATDTDVAPEVAAAPGRKRRGVLLVLAVLALAGIGGAMALVDRSQPASNAKPASPQQAPATPAAAEPAKPAEPERIKVTLTSAPAGATVMDVAAGASLGTTPLTVERDPGSPDLPIALVLAGYQREAIKLRFAESTRTHVRLVAEPKPVAPPVQPAPEPEPRAAKRPARRPRPSKRPAADAPSPSAATPPPKAPPPKKKRASEKLLDDLM